MASFPRSLQHLIDVFQKILPGVGPKNAERFALALVRKDVPSVQALLDAIANVKKQITTCAICFDFAEKTPCAICADPRRDSAILCVVADTQGVLAIEKTGAYKGRYLVLGGLLSPIEGRTPDQLKIKELVERVRSIQSKKIDEMRRAGASTDRGVPEGTVSEERNEARARRVVGASGRALPDKALDDRSQFSSIGEIILAFDSTMDGEATALYIKRLLAPTKIHITRLARGLPMGSDLEYADEITLTDALQGRRDV